MEVSKLAGMKFRDNNELLEELKKLYAADIQEYTRQCGGDEQFPFVEENQWALLTDCIKEAGQVGQDYFLQDLWCAREIYRSNVKTVYDIGSRIDGFIAHLLAMEVNVTLLDIRPFPHPVEGIRFIQANAMDLSTIPDNYMETVSGLCSFEHFGLGRYSDPIDYDGWKKALNSVKRKMKAGGMFYLSVPVGPKNKVVFNAHRVFNPVTIAREMLPEVSLQQFSYIADWKINTCLSGDIRLDDLEAVSETLPELKTSGVFGLFAFKKKILTPPHTHPRQCYTRIKLILIITFSYFMRIHSIMKALNFAINKN